MTAIVKRNLKSHEEIIDSGVRSFIDVGRSLLAIRDERLYLEHHESFEAYCKQRWGFTRNRALQYIQSTTAVDDVVTIVTTGTRKTSEKSQIPAPENESQARAIAEAAPDANTRRHVWQAAVASAPRDKDGKPKITASLVKKTAAEVIGRNGDSEPPPLPIPLREPGEDPPEPAHSEQLDHFKTAVPDCLREIFAEVGEFSKLRKLCADIKSGAKNVCETRAGGWLKGHLQELEEHCDQIKRLVRFAAPHTECAKCRRKPEKKCPACKGTGWVTEAMMTSSFSDADKKWLESR